MKPLVPFDTRTEKAVLAGLLLIDWGVALGAVALFGSVYGRALG